MLLILLPFVRSSIGPSGCVVNLAWLIRLNQLSLVPLFADEGDAMPPHTLPTANLYFATVYEHISEDLTLFVDPYVNVWLSSFVISPDGKQRLPRTKAPQLILAG